MHRLSNHCDAQTEFFEWRSLQPFHGGDVVTCFDVVGCRVRWSNVVGCGVTWGEVMWWVARCYSSTTRQSTTNWFQLPDMIQLCKVTRTRICSVRMAAPGGPVSRSKPSIWLNGMRLDGPITPWVITLESSQGLFSWARKVTARAVWTVLRASLPLTSALSYICVTLLKTSNDAAPKVSSTLRWFLRTALALVWLCWIGNWTCAHVSAEVVSSALTTSKQFATYVASAGYTVKSTKTNTSLRLVR